jgi:glucokinase
VLPDGTRLGRVARPTPVADGPPAVIEAAAEALRAAREAAGSAGRAVDAIGISSPGPLDPWRGVVLSPPNLGTAFHGVPFAAEIEEQVGLPAFLERDTNVAALAESAYGAARGCRDFLYLTVSTGFGGAIVSEGRLILGPDGTAGELGHLQVELDGPLCGCGGSGHVEAMCSGRALARDARTAVDTGRSPFLNRRLEEKRSAAGPTTADDRATAAAGEPARTTTRTSGPTPATVELDAHDVADGDAAGDAICRELMERARAAFAAAVVGAVNLLNPSLIVVGGAIADGQGDLLFGPAREAIATGTFPVPGGRVKIVPAELGADVSLAGAHPLVAARIADPAFIRPTSPGARRPVTAGA